MTDKPPLFNDAAIRVRLDSKGKPVMIPRAARDPFDGNKTSKIKAPTIGRGKSLKPGKPAMGTKPAKAIAFGEIHVHHPFTQQVEPFSIVVFNTLGTPFHFARCAAYNIQITGLSPSDCFSAMAETLETFMIEWDWDAEDWRIKFAKSRDNQDIEILLNLRDRHPGSNTLWHRHATHIDQRTKVLPTWWPKTDA